MSPRSRFRSAFVSVLGLLALVLLAPYSAAQGLTDFTIDLTTSGATFNDFQGVRWSEGAGTGGGTGVFHPFLRLQADGIEKGFNTDYTPVPLDDKVGSWTHAITLGSLQTVTVNDTAYYSFHLDANELSGDPNQLLCMDDLRLYSSTNPAIPDTSALFSSATLRYGLFGPVSVNLNTGLHPGGGTADMTVLIPTLYFTGVDPGAYVYLYSSFGDCDSTGLSASDGFEEWSALAAADTAPTVTAPLAVNGEEGGTLTFDVSASDPDGDPIGSLTANLTPLPEGNDASFVARGDNSQGTFLWHMMPGNAGTYNVTFSATSNDLTGSATTRIDVRAAGANITGVLTWTPQAGQEGTYHVTFTATDDGGSTSATDTINVFAPILAPSPSAPLAPHAPTLRFGGSPAPQAPQAVQKGPIISGTGTVNTTTGQTVTVSVSAQTDLSSGLSSRPLLSARIERAASAAQAAPTLTVNTSELPEGNDATFVVDHQPVVTAAATATIAPGATLILNITATDPDGEAIDALTADLSNLPSGNPGSFTAGSTNMSGTLTWTPRLADVGSYTVTFSASNRLVGLASTTITVSQPAAARIFVMDPVQFNIGSSRASNCIFIEPVSGSFSLSSVSISTIRMVSTGTGAVSEIALLPGKTALIADRDNNHIQDLAACFAKSDLRLLFSLITGKQTVPIKIQGRLDTGAYFVGTASVTVIANGQAVGSASLAPNPLNPQATLSLNLGKGGWLRVSIYDLQGRLVRKLVDETNAIPGPRQIPIDGLDSHGALLSSGVYYYRVESADGIRNGKLAIVR